MLSLVRNIPFILGIVGFQIGIVSCGFRAPTGLLDPVSTPAPAPSPSFSPSPSPVVGAGNPAVLAVSGPLAGLNSTCLGPYTFSVLDSLSALVPVPGDTLLSVSSTVGGFFDTSSCSHSVSSLTVLAASSSQTAYFQGNGPGSVTLQSSAPGLQTGTLVVSLLSASPVALRASGPATGTTSDCLAYAVSAVDSLNSPQPLAANKTVAFTDGGLGGTFFSDSGCASSVTSLVMPAGSSTFTVRYKRTVVGNSTLHFSASGLTAASTALMIGYSSATALALTGSSGMTTASCAPFSVVGQDSTGALGSFTTNAVVALSDGGIGGSFFSDPSCTLPISTVLAASGTNSATFFYQNSTPSMGSLGATSAGLTSGSMNITVLTAPPNHLVFSGPYGITTVVCSTYSLLAKNAANATVTVGSDTPLTLSDGGAGGTFYSDSGCTSPIASAVILNGGSSTSSFYYQKTLAGPLTLQASATGFSPALTSVTDTEGPSAVLTISDTLISPVSVLDCLSYTVTSQDAFGNVANVQVNTSISLSGGGTAGVFYTNSSCASSTTTVTTLAGTSSKSYYYKKTQPGSVTLQASRPGMAIGSRPVTVLAGPPAQLAFTTAPTLFAAGSCANFKVNLRDQPGNTVNAAAGTTITLGGAGDGAFYTNSGCTTLVSSSTIPIGSSQYSYYFKKPTQGTVALTAASPPLTSATSNTITVTSGAPTGLFFSSGATAFVQNTCQAFSVQSRDEGGLAANVASALAVSLASSGSSDAFYSDAACSMSVASVSLAVGTSAKTFYYKMTAPGSANLTASSSLSNPVRSVVVSSGVPQILFFSTGSASFTNNSCAAFTVITRDENAITVPVVASTDLSLTGGGASGTFYSNPACSAPITLATMAPGTSSKIFYYLNTLNASQTLMASASGFTAGTKAVTTVSGPAARLAVTAGSTSFPINTCQSFTVTTSDLAGYVVNANANIAVNLGGAAVSGTFYVDVSCTAVVTSVTLLAGNSSQLFFYQATAPGAATFTVSGAGLSGGTYGVTAN